MSCAFKGLYAIVDHQWAPKQACFDLAQAYLEGGARILQLRMKHSTERAVFKEAKKIARLKEKFNFLFIVNDRVTVAKEVGADGVHVGSGDLSIEEVRRLVGPRMWVGYSSHSLQEALEAEKWGADYVAFGAIFTSKTKGSGHPVQGLEKLKEVVATLSVPVVAIGGIRRSNVRTVQETGVDSIAMISALTEAQNIVNEVRYYCRLLKT